MKKFVLIPAVIAITSLMTQNAYSVKCRDVCDSVGSVSFTSKSTALGGHKASKEENTAYEYGWTQAQDQVKKFCREKEYDKLHKLLKGMLGNLSEKATSPAVMAGIKDFLGALDAKDGCTQ